MDLSISRWNFVVVMGIALKLSIFIPVDGALSGESAIQRCRNLILTTRPKLGFSSETFNSFDVRIEGHWGGPALWTSQNLLNAAATHITVFQEKLHELGFSQTHYLNVLVEKHPGAVNCPVLGGMGTCLIISPWALIETPGLFGRSIFFGSQFRQTSKGSTVRTLVFTAFSNDIHSIFSPFIVAHELAHNTEPIIGGSSSGIWQEARADFLAYLVTGEAEVIFPSGHPPHQFSEIGERIPILSPSRRSLKMPVVSKLSQLIPNKHAYHENSEIISSLLYRLDNKFGAQWPIAFINWIDQANEGIILSLDEAVRESTASYHIEYGPDIKEGWIKVVESFLGALISWSEEQTNEDILHWLKEEISEIATSN